VFQTQKICCQSNLKLNFKVSWDNILWVRNIAKADKNGEASHRLRPGQEQSKAGRGQTEGLRLLHNNYSTKSEKG
jgi:hypothetical protein